MEHGQLEGFWDAHQLETEIEAIPLLPLPLPQALDFPLDPRSSVVMYEEIPSVEVITDCETKQQMEEAEQNLQNMPLMEEAEQNSENMPPIPTPTRTMRLTNHRRKILMRRKSVLLCLQKSFDHVEEQVEELNSREISKLHSILMQEGEEALNLFFMQRYRDLRKAVSLRDVQSVKRHIAAGASLTLTRRGGVKMSILHCCIEEYGCRSVQHKVPQNYFIPIEMEIIQEILAAAEQAENKSDILNCLDKYGRSPLYLAIECGNFEVCQALIKSGANVENVSHKKETALHVAVQHPDILKYFLDHHIIENSVDTRGYTAIHAAAKFDEVDSFKLLVNRFEVTNLISSTFDGSTVLHVVAENGSTKLADILIQNPDLDDLISRTDNNDETALNRSAKHGHKAVTALLLCNGAVLSDNGQERRTAAEQIARKFPDPLKFFEDVFDEFITENDSSAMCKESKVHVNYKVLTNNDYHSMSQIKVIEELVRCGQSELLLHPLIESLLYLKWRCLLPVFYTMIAIYAFFLVSFNTFLVTTFHRRDADNCSNSFNGSNAQCHKCFDVYDWIWIVLIYLSIFLLLGQECVYIYLQRRRYFAHLESWVKLCLLALAAVVPPGVICGEPADWLRHVSCAALLLSWLQAMFLLSRFPDWGYYVLMFERVAYNIFKILLTSICLVIGFSFCFMIQYRSESPFDGPEAAFVKTLVMMSSEFDYEGLFAEEHNAALDHTRTLVRLLFVIFVVFIAIVLMNFMIGIAVSDINELNKIGNIRRLEKQVELHSTLGVVVDLLFKLFKRLSRMKFHHNISKDIVSDEKWKVCYGVDCLDDEYEQYLTTDLQNAIINVAKRKAERKKDNRNKNEEKNRLDVMYDTLMKLPPYLELDKQEGDAKALDDKMFYENTEASFILMQNKITSLEISNKDMKLSMNELKENMKKILAIMISDGTIRNEKTTRCDHLKYKNSSSLTNRPHSIKSFSL